MKIEVVDAEGRRISPNRLNINEARRPDYDSVRTSLSMHGAGLVGGVVDSGLHVVERRGVLFVHVSAADCLLSDLSVTIYYVSYLIYL